MATGSSLTLVLETDTTPRVEGAVTSFFSQRWGVQLTQAERRGYRVGRLGTGK